MAIAADIKCAECGRVIAGEVHNVNGYDYCAECHRETFTTCADCGAEVARDDARTVNGDDYCEDCYGERFEECEHCGEVIDRERSYPSENGDVYCEDCYSDLFTCCDDCGCELYRDDARYTDNGTYCDGCYPDGWQPGHFRPSESFREVGSTRRFGVELETSQCPDYEELQGETCFGAKDDASITGKEFISPPLSSDKGLEAIREFCRLAEGFEVDEKCGFHLHIDLSRVSVAGLRRVALAYRLTQQLWARFVSESRRGNYYCKPLEYAPSTAEGVETREDWDSFVDRCGDRYKWANWQAYRAHGTVEIRLHTSTLDPEKICNWVKAHLRFVDWAIAHDESEIRESLTHYELDSQFGALAEIWADPALADFYAARAKKFGHRFAKEVA